MFYKVFIFIVTAMLLGSAGYYMYLQRGVADGVLSNQQETSDLLDDQKRLVADSAGKAPIEAGATTTVNEVVTGELIAGNYSSESGIEVIIKRNKKVMFIAPASPVSKGTWQLISNNVLSVTVTTNGTATKYLFSIEDPEREIVEIKTGNPTIYTRQ